MHLYELEGAEPAEPAPVTPEAPAAPTTPAATPETPAAQVTPPVEARDFYDVVAGAVWNEEDPVSDDSLKGITPEMIGAMDPAARLVLAGIVKRDKERVAAWEKEKATFEESKAAVEAEHQKTLAEIKRQQLAYSRAVADPAVIDKLRADIAAKPAVVNPADPASLEASIRAAAAEAQLNAMGPAAEQYDKLSREAGADSTFSAVGLDRKNADDLKAVNAKIRELYGRDGMKAEDLRAHLETLRASAQRTGGRPPTEVAVALVAAERKAAADAARRADETSARMAGARALSTGTSRQQYTPTDDEHFTTKMKAINGDAEAFDVAWRTDERFRKAAQQRASL